MNLRSSSGPPGEAGSPGSQGAPGVPGLVAYNASGPVGAVKVWMGTATVDSSGNFAGSFTGVTFTTVLHVDVTVRSVSNSGVVTVTGLTFNATGLSGTCRGINVIVAVLTLGLNNISGSTLTVTAWGV